MENKTAEKKTPRDLVLSMLLKTIEEGAFSHLVLQDALSDERTEPKDRLFIRRLFYGVLEQTVFLDWIISSYSSVKIKKMKPVIRNILRMSIYQMLFMDSVPDHAAVNEAVRLTKARGLKGLVPFVNGLLRSFQRGGIRPGMPENVRHSVPSWLYDLEVKELGKEKADAFFDAAADPEPRLYARINTEAHTAEEILSMLAADGCRAERVPEMEEALQLFKVQDLTQLEAYKKGLLFVQDLSSMYVGKTAADLSEGKEIRRILDVCAAPGGKSLHLAEKFPEASVLARDLSPKKAALIEENIRRSGKQNIRAEAFDALSFDEQSVSGMDIVIADLPCSGLGVIGRKPDIRLRVTEEDPGSLAELQRQILNTVWQYVRPGGLLLYSTCTVNRAENQENAAWFLENHPFDQIYERQFIPGQDPTDGFYLSAFRRKRG